MGGGTTVQSTTIPPKSANELEAEKINLDMIKMQKQQLDQANLLANPQGTLTQFDEAAKAGTPHQYDTPDFRQALQDQIDTNTFNKELRAKLQKQFLNQGKLTDEESALLDQTYKAQESRAQEGLRLYGNEIAGMRGMRPSDSPIGGDLLRQQALLQEGLGSARASASLDLMNRNKIFNEQVNQFQEGLRQQAFMNRLALGTAQQPGLAFQGLGLQERMAQPSTTNTFSPSIGSQFATGFNTFANVAAGLGRLGQGGGYSTILKGGGA